MRPLIVCRSRTRLGLPARAAQTEAVPLATLARSGRAMDEQPLANPTGQPGAGVPLALGDVQVASRRLSISRGPSRSGFGRAGRMSCGSISTIAGGAVSPWRCKFI